MANPNKTVAAARKKMDRFPNRPPRPVDPFIEWLCANPVRSQSFKSIEEARKAFDASK